MTGFASGNSFSKPELVAADRISSGRTLPDLISAVSAEALRAFPQELLEVDSDQLSNTPFWIKEAKDFPQTLNLAGKHHSERHEEVGMKQD